MSGVAEEARGRAPSPSWSLVLGLTSVLAALILYFPCQAAPKDTTFLTAGFIELARFAAVEASPWCLTGQWDEKQGFRASLEPEPCLPSLWLPPCNLLPPGALACLVFSMSCISTWEVMTVHPSSGTWFFSRNKSLMNLILCLTLGGLAGDAKISAQGALVLKEQIWAFQLLCS